MKQYPHEFSGGMRQRGMIAMAIANNPSVLIADEPTTALDVTIQAQIVEVLKAAQSETHAATILITHDLGLIAELADRVVVMYAGRVVELSDVFAMFKQPGHPYTVGLMNSLARVDIDQDEARADSRSAARASSIATGMRVSPALPAVARARASAEATYHRSGRSPEARPPRTRPRVTSPRS